MCRLRCLCHAVVYVVPGQEEVPCQKQRRICGEGVEYIVFTALWIVFLLFYVCAIAVSPRLLPPAMLSPSGTALGLYVSCGNDVPIAHEVREFGAFDAPL